MIVSPYAHKRTDPYIASVNALCHFEPAGTGLFYAHPNYYSATATGTPIAGDFTPYANKRGDSVWFNGTTDYLSMSGYPIASKTFTVEFWFYAEKGGGVVQGLVSCDYANNFHIGIGNTARIDFWIAGAVISTPVYTDAQLFNQWHHLACIRRYNGTSAIYLDGAQVATGPLNGTNSSTGQLKVGVSTHNSTELFQGYIAGFRLCGEALSTGAFTPPTEPVTATESKWSGSGVTTYLMNSPVILWVVDQAIAVKDWAKKWHFSASGGAAASTTRKWGTTAYALGSLNSAAQLKSAILRADQKLTANFTIELWVQLSSASSMGIFGIFASAYNEAGGLALYYVKPTPKLYVMVGGTATAFSITLNTTDFHHLALVRTNTSIRLYANGAHLGAATASSATFGATAGSRLIIGSGISTYAAATAVDEIRITNGVARYAAQGFTAPTDSFPEE